MHIVKSTAVINRILSVLIPSQMDIWKLPMSVLHIVLHLATALCYLLTHVYHCARLCYPNVMSRLLVESSVSLLESPKACSLQCSPDWCNLFLLHKEIQFIQGNVSEACDVLLHWFRQVDDVRVVVRATPHNLAKSMSGMHTCIICCQGSTLHP